MNRVTWFVFFAIIAVSCLDEPDCFQLNNNIVILNFKIIGGGNDAYPLDSIKSPLLDSTFYEDSVITTFELPLNPLERETDFIFAGAGGVVKELHLTYNRQVQFVSQDCGERYIFSDLKVPSHDFDSIRVINTTPTRPASTNFDIYRCPRTTLMGIKFDEAVTVDSITTDYGPIYTSGEPGGNTLESIALPLDTRRTTTSFTFKFTNDSTRVLKVNYNIIPQTLATQCGEQTFISNLYFDTEINKFTAVNIAEDSIHDLPVTNLEITP